MSKSSILGAGNSNVIISFVRYFYKKLSSIKAQ